MSSDGLDLLLKRATGPTAVATLPPSIDGVLVLRAADGTERSYAVSAPVIAAASARRPTAIRRRARSGWWQALLLAFVGGAILNLMPCVFPILSLKLLGIAVSVHRAEERRHGLPTPRASSSASPRSAALLLALRAGGAAIGWGFQLQSPVVVALLAYMLFAMGLSLSGVVEFGVGWEVSAAALPSGTGLAGAVATGILATVVATPCTAPFMGTALGYAMLAPPIEALAVFVALGAGLAAPVVLATAIPASRVCCRGRVRGCCGSSSSWRFRSMRRSPG